MVEVTDSGKHSSLLLYGYDHCHERFIALAQFGFSFKFKQFSRGLKNWVVCGCYAWTMAFFNLLAIDITGIFSYFQLIKKDYIITSI